MSGINDFVERVKCMISKFTPDTKIGGLASCKVAESAK